MYDSVLKCSFFRFQEISFPTDISVFKYIKINKMTREKINRAGAANFEAYFPPKNAAYLINMSKH